MPALTYKFFAVGILVAPGLPRGSRRPGAETPRWVASAVGAEVQAAATEVQAWVDDAVAGGTLGLIREVRELQRNNPAAKEQWKLYCAKYSDGNPDPKRHDADFLQGFLDHYNEGYRLLSMATALRLCMEVSPALEEAWEAYLGPAQRDFDPMYQSEDHIKKFLRNVRVELQPKMVMDEEKALLVAKVKALTSAQQDLWQLWRSMIDGNPDPALQEKGVLADFVAQYGAHLLEPKKDALVSKASTTPVKPQRASTILVKPQKAG